MNEPQLQVYEFGDFRLCTAKRLLTKGNDEPLPLTPKVFDTLLYLVRHNGRVIEKDEFLREIWTDTIVEENNLSQNISILRRVLGEKPGEGRFIATVPGHGFRFVPEVAELFGKIFRAARSANYIYQNRHALERTSRRAALCRNRQTNES